MSKQRDAERNSRPPAVDDAPERRSAIAALPLWASPAWSCLRG
jgi:hypothetical protein